MLYHFLKDHCIFLITELVLPVTAERQEKSFRFIGSNRWVSAQTYPRTTYKHENSSERRLNSIRSWSMMPKGSNTKSDMFFHSSSLRDLRYMIFFNNSSESVAIKHIPNRICSDLSGFELAPCVFCSVSRIQVKGSTFKKKSSWLLLSLLYTFCRSIDVRLAFLTTKTLFFYIYNFFIEISHKSNRLLA